MNTNKRKIMMLEVNNNDEHIGKIELIARNNNPPIISNAEINETIHRLKNVNPNIEEWAEFFDVFDSEKKGVLLSTDIPDLLKSLNVKISDIEVGQLIKENDKYLTGFITKKDFLEIFAIYGDNYDAFDTADILDAFKIFDDDGKGVIKEDAMITILHKYGEKISQDEAINLLRDIEYDDSVPYLTFVKNNSIL